MNGLSQAGRAAGLAAIVTAGAEMAIADVTVSTRKSDLSRRAAID